MQRITYMKGCMEPSAKGGMMMMLQPPSFCSATPLCHHISSRFDDNNPSHPIPSLTLVHLIVTLLLILDRSLVFSIAVHLLVGP